MTALVEQDVAPAPGVRTGAGRRRAVGAAALVLVAVAVVSVASVLVGSRALAPTDVWAALLDDGHQVHGVVDARVARTALGLAVGAALGLAGALLQGLTRNPLADPGILGVNAGASFAMVLAISVFGVSALSGYVWFAFAGAAVAMVLVHAIAALGRDGATPMKLAIAGAALTAAVTSWTSGVLLTDKQTMDVFRLWQVGTIGGRSYDVLVLGLPFLVVGALLGLGCARTLNALALGDDLARGLGRRVWLDRLVVGLAVVLLAGTATALAGPVAFVGLIVPHAVRALAGPDYARVLPLSVVGGAVLVVAADTLGRVVLPPTEVQVGIMTAVIGAPVFLWLVRRGRTGAL
jgi:iron complex transport system permease protein